MYAGRIHLIPELMQMAPQGRQVEEEVKASRVVIFVCRLPPLDSDSRTASYPARLLAAFEEGIYHGDRAIGYWSKCCCHVLAPGTY